MAIISKELTIASWTSGTPSTYKYSFDTAVGTTTYSNTAGIDLGDIASYTPAATDVISVSRKKNNIGGRLHFRHTGSFSTGDYTNATVTVTLVDGTVIGPITIGSSLANLSAVRNDVRSKLVAHSNYSAAKVSIAIGAGGASMSFLKITDLSGDYATGAGITVNTGGGGDITKFQSSDLTGAEISNLTSNVKSVFASQGEDGNSIHWITWASSTWTLYLGSENHLGKFSVFIKTL